MKRDRKILLLSWGVPPETTGSSIIVGNLAKQFRRDELVVAGERPTARPAVCWKEDWPEIVYVTSGWPLERRGARWWRRGQTVALILRSLRLARVHRCASIVCVFPNEEYLLAGYVTALLSRTPFFPYFHNTFVEQYPPNTLRRRWANWLQAKVFAKAAHVLVMSEGMMELYRERYPSLRCSPLLHSFNEDIPEFAPPPAPEGRVKFAMSGNVNASCTDAAVRIVSALKRMDSHITILSGTPKRYLHELGLLGEQVSHLTVSRDLVVSHLREADIILLPHGFTGGLSDEEYRTIFPTKTIEYLISGRPILAHVPAKSYVSRFLRTHDCALIVDAPDDGAICAAARRLCEDAQLRCRLVRNALRAARAFHAPAVAAELRRVLRLTQSAAVG